MDEPEKIIQITTAQTMFNGKLRTPTIYGLSNHGIVYRLEMSTKLSPLPARKWKRLIGSLEKNKIL